MQVLRYVGALMVMTGGSGCSYPKMEPAPLGPAAVIVHNQSESDVDVYIWDAWDRATRLGFLASNDTASFEIADGVTAAPGPYHLEARVSQGADRPTQSEPFALRPGYRITWMIPSAAALGLVGGAFADSGSPARHTPRTIPPLEP